MDSPDTTRLELTGCPECGAPAETTERFVLGSTAGPVEHVTVRCAARHWFRLATERLPAAASGPVGEEDTGRWTRSPTAR